MSCGDIKIFLGRSPLVMGILNVTPDSFSDGGRYHKPEQAVRRAREMIDAGADIIDVGGESTRPGSAGITAGEELDRVLPVIDALSGGSPSAAGTGVPISIDTQKPEVADEALKHGCHMINDIGGGGDPGMVEVLHRHSDRIPIVIMHKLGDPKSMQDSPEYENVVREVTDFLNERADSLLRAGISEERIIIDPGLGFGKRFRDNLELLNALDSLSSLGYPLLVGASRKRFLGELLNADTDNRMAGTPPLPRGVISTARR